MKQTIIIGFIGYVIAVALLLFIKAKYSLQGSGIPIAIAMAIPYLMAILRHYRSSKNSSKNAD